MRLFVAFPLPEPVLAEVASRSARLAARLPRARWVAPASLHLTLAFLGEVDEERAAALPAALAPVFAATPALELRVEGAGVFPPRGRARVAWLGVRADGDLAGLAGRVAAAAAGITGRPPEGRPFAPHLTLARCDPPWGEAAAAAFAAAFPGPVGDAFRAGAGLLMRSTLGAGGARHQVRERFPLGAPAEATG